MWPYKRVFIQGRLLWKVYLTRKTRQPSCRNVVMIYLDVVFPES